MSNASAPDMLATVRESVRDTRENLYRVDWRVENHAGNERTDYSLIPAGSEGWARAMVSALLSDDAEVTDVQPA